MIRYALKCHEDHGFESWFQSAEAYETLRSRGLVVCPECGSTQVEKAIMAPPVRAARKAEAAKAKRDAAIAAMRAQVERDGEYVGKDFAKEARAIHDGEKPERQIYGEAKLEDAKKLVEDGIPVAPLPFTPKAKLS